MKNRKHKFWVLKFICAALVYTFLNTPFIKAQNPPQTVENQFTVPSTEEFVETDALISPSRVSGCRTLNWEYKVSDCYYVTAVEYGSSSRNSIYNDDATLWFLIDFDSSSPNYFLKNTKLEFSPFWDGKNYGDRFPDFVVLRLVGESKNWYKVEVNEEKQLIKYIYKGDPLWTKRNWSYWHFYAVNFRVDKPLLNAPDGEIVKESKFDEERRAKIKKIEDDWAFVEIYEGNDIIRGWAKWREGRKLLVGCFLNDFKIPK